jgi:hypothetical protein
MTSSFLDGRAACTFRARFAPGKDMRPDAGELADPGRGLRGPQDSY